VSARPIPASPDASCGLFLDVRRHLDDFQHAGQVRRGIDIDDAHAARRDVGEDFRVAERRLAIDGGGSLGLAD
jgi:hypothetical protein